MTRRSGFDPGVIDDLARRLHEAVPQALRDMQHDLEQNFKAVLQSTLARLDLVTREEFDVQTAVLERTRAKLDALQQRLDELESRASAADQKDGAPPESGPL
ncbi:accessory factor UbiK family protein [soil metagenome]